MIDEQALQERFAALAPELDERQRRLLAASEARAAGYGGIAAVARASGCAPSTIGRGLKDLAGETPLEPGRVRRRGGGRKPRVAHDPSLLDDLLGLVEPEARGDPMSPLRWTCKSLPKLAAELRVNFVAVSITDAKGKTTYANAFVTSLPVSADSVAEIVACARARWKIENESFNVLETNGYHLEHNFGHGKQNLAMMLAALNLLAFAIHTVCDCLEALWIEARARKRARKRFFEHIRTITAYIVFPNWTSLTKTLITSIPPPADPASAAGAS